MIMPSSEDHQYVEQIDYDAKASHEIHLSHESKHIRFVWFEKSTLLKI